MDDRVLPPPPALLLLTVHAALHQGGGGLTVLDVDCDLVGAGVLAITATGQSAVNISTSRERIVREMSGKY